MARVSFKTRRGQAVSFRTRPGRRKGSRKPNAYAKFVGKKIKARKRGTSVKTAMKSAAKAWQFDKKKASTSRRKRK